MSNDKQQTHIPEQKKDGYDISRATFDQDGNVDGLDLDALDDVVGGTVSGGGEPNRMCPIEN